MRNAMSILGTVAVASAVLLVAASAPAATPSARPAIEKAGAAFAATLAKGDSAGLAAMYAPDAQVFPPNSDVVTGTAIQKTWQDVIDAGVKSMKLTILDVVESGDLAVESGRADLYGADGKVVDSGKYVAVWKLVGGRWKILRDIWNTSQPAPASK